MSTPYTLSPFSPADAAQGSARITAAVHGYWSRDVITLYINRKGWRDADAGWAVELSHSSGGRDKDQLASDLDAEQNFGMALLAASAKGREVLTMIPEMEAAYQAYRAEREAEEAAKQAANVAAYEADAPIGEELAAEYMAVLAAGCFKYREMHRSGRHEVKSSGSQIALVPRGKDQAYNTLWAVRRDESSPTYWYDSHNKISKAAALALIAQASKAKSIISGE